MVGWSCSQITAAGIDGHCSSVDMSEPIGLYHNLFFLYHILQIRTLCFARRSIRRRLIGYSWLFAFAYVVFYWSLDTISIICNCSTEHGIIDARCSQVRHRVNVLSAVRYGFFNFSTCLYLWCPGQIGAAAVYIMSEQIMNISDVCRRGCSLQAWRRAAPGYCHTEPRGCVDILTDLIACAPPQP